MRSDDAAELSEKEATVKKVEDQLNLRARQLDEREVCTALRWGCARCCCFVVVVGAGCVVFVRGALCIETHGCGTCNVACLSTASTHRHTSQAAMEQEASARLVKFHKFLVRRVRTAQNSADPVMAMRKAVKRGLAAFLATEQGNDRDVAAMDAPTGCDYCGNPDHGALQDGIVVCPVLASVPRDRVRPHAFVHLDGSPLPESYVQWWHSNVDKGVDLHRLALKLKKEAGYGLRL